MFSPPKSSSAGARDSHIPVTIQPLDESDIPACARLTAAVFAVDPHTIVKQLGRQPFDMFAIASSDLERNIKLERCTCVKAVDEQGTIVGHASWSIRSGQKKCASSSGVEGNQKVAAELDDKPPQAYNDDSIKEENEAKEEAKDPIDRLHALEDADMQYWLQHMIPTDSPCMIALGLAVQRGYEGKGIGTALLRHGNAIADAKGLPIWVHSSHQAYAAHSKAGFETRRELRIDLDKYAPREPRDGEVTMAMVTGKGEDEDGGWGEYVIRYMERKPVSNS